jgi:hypothetical protein
VKHDIPFDVRKSVDERDGRFCRCCGTYAGTARELHHVVYGGSVRGMGGRRVHNVDEIVTLCGLCHHTRVHAQKKRWDDLLLEVIREWPGFTAMQVERWRTTGQA